MARVKTTKTPAEQPVVEKATKAPTKKTKAPTKDAEPVAATKVVAAPVPVVSEQEDTVPESVEQSLT